jgi:hypothetical protein
MRFVRAIPRLGALPELLGFYCAPCHQAMTIESNSESDHADDAELPKVPMN